MKNVKPLYSLLKKYFFVTLIIFVIILQVIFPNLSMNSFFQGLIIWATKVLPALLPFFILTKLLTYTQFVTTIGNKFTPLTRKLYGVGGVSGYVYIMSIISGYPVGAKLTADLYSNKTISARQAYTITSFTSTSGPLFILGTVGIGLFKSAKIGIIVLLSHYLSAIINGLFYRIRETENKINIQSDHSVDNFISESMTSSISSIMMVGGFIAIFYMILSLLNSIHAFSPISNLLALIGVDKNISIAIVSGLIEVTTGSIMLSELNLGYKITTMILSFLIAFGGLSIHAQAYAFLKTFKMPYFTFFKQKITQALISLAITSVIIIFI